MIKKMCLLLLLGFVYAPAFAVGGYDCNAKLVDLKKKEDKAGPVFMAEDNGFITYSNAISRATIDKKTGEITVVKNGCCQIGDVNKKLALRKLIKAYNKQKEKL